MLFAAIRATHNRPDRPVYILAATQLRYLFVPMLPSWLQHPHNNKCTSSRLPGHHTSLVSCLLALQLAGQLVLRAALGSCAEIEQPRWLSQATVEHRIEVWRLANANHQPPVATQHSGTYVAVQSAMHHSSNFHPICKHYRCGQAGRPHWQRYTRWHLLLLAISGAVSCDVCVPQAGSALVLRFGPAIHGPLCQAHTQRPQPAVLMGACFGWLHPATDPVVARVVQSIHSRRGVGNTPETATTSMAMSSDKTVCC